MELAARTLEDLLTVSGAAGLVISEVKLADGTHVIMYPKDKLPDPKDPKAPPELPERFEDLPVPNWNEPQGDTEEAVKAAAKAQELTDEEVFGAKIPVE